MQKNERFNLSCLLPKFSLVKIQTIVKWEKVSEYFSDLTITTAGSDEVMRYANQALKTQVEELLVSHLFYI